MYLASRVRLLYTPSVECVVSWTIRETQPVCSENFSIFWLRHAHMREKIPGSPCFSYCKRDGKLGGAWERGYYSATSSCSTVASPDQPMENTHVCKHFLQLLKRQYILVWTVVEHTKFICEISDITLGSIASWVLCKYANNIGNTILCGDWKGTCVRVEHRYNSLKPNGKLAFVHLSQSWPARLQQLQLPCACIHK